MVINPDAYEAARTAFASAKRAGWADYKALENAIYVYLQEDKKAVRLCPIPAR